jgi:hypothetical protein
MNETAEEMSLEHYVTMTGLGPKHRAVREYWTMRNEAEQYDPGADLIHANRDAILEIHQDALRRIQRVVNTIEAVEAGFTTTEAHVNARLLRKIVDAAWSFHPMHAESWSGFPEGS